MGPKNTRTADIHNQHQGELPLFYKLLDERMVHPGGDIPVNGTDLVPGLILAHLVKVHSLALEHAVILSRQRFTDQAVGANFNLPDFLENLAWNHGTGNWSKIFWITVSLVISSASAS
ncbi:hypothetical protein SDC9_148276 [bioreactor metagenome]|uniref:Uncharacterized protein n=1 Tax=bioreactor metagenome TaxID=1076179 RepID=A0A645EI02_9ZZZZ